MIVTSGFLKHLFTLIALMALLGVSFLLAHINLGPFSLFVGLSIGLLKAILVGLFFMDLRHSDGIHRIFALAGVFLLLILFMLSLADFFSRAWLVMPGQFPAPPGSNLYEPR